MTTAPTMFDDHGTLLPELSWWQRTAEALTSTKLPLLIGLLVFMVCSAVVIFTFPVNMDELVQYHRLACEYYPAARYHTFREGCQLYEMDFLGFNFYRAFGYIGNLHDPLFYPLFVLFKSQYAVYALNLILFIVFALLTARAFSLNYKTALLPLLYFPVFYQFIKDSGPVSFSLLCLPLLVLSVKAAVTSPILAVRIAGSGAAVLLCVLGTEDKAYFLYTLPMLLCFTAAPLLNLTADESLPQKLLALPRAQLTRLIITAVLCCAVPLCYMAILKFTSTGESYLSALTGGAGKLDRDVVDVFTSILLYVVSPLNFGDRIFAPPAAYFQLSELLWLPLLGLGLWGLCRYRHFNSPILLGFVLFAAILLFTHNTQFSHHYMYLHLPLLLGFMIWANRSPQVFTAVTLALAVNCAAAVLMLHASPQYVHSEKSREQVFAWLSQPQNAQHSIINFTDWGGYYNQSLFGDKAQLVTFTEPFTAEKAQRLTQLAAQSGRPEILNVCWICNAQSLAPFYAGHSLTEITFSSHWKVIKVTPATSPSPTTPQQ